MMQASSNALDEYTIAAFIAGTLSENDRRSVVSHLLKDDDAREWLHMACEALAVAKEEPMMNASWTDVAPRPPVASPDRAARRYVPCPRNFS